MSKIQNTTNLAKQTSLIYIFKKNKLILTQIFTNTTSLIYILETIDQILPQILRLTLQKYSYFFLFY